MFTNLVFGKPSLIAVSLMALLSGCNASNFYLNQNLGSASGATLGKAATGNPRENDARSTPSAVDALAGGLIGGSIGDGLDKKDRHDALQAEYNALEFTPSGDSVDWRNQTTGNHGTVIPSETYDIGVMNCRRYTHKVVINGVSRTAKGTACKEEYGSWHPLI